MFCRRALQRVGPLARWLLRPISKSTAPVRHMALGVPGGSTNLAYVVLCGGGLTAAVVYAYKTVNGDTERYEDRLANMSSEEKAEVTSEAASSPPAESAPAEDEPAPGAEITPEPVPASPEPAAETSAEPTNEASPEEPAAAEASEAGVTEAPAEPADAEGAPVAEEETALEVGSEVAAVTLAEDAAAAAESAAVQALGEEHLGNALHQMEDDGKELNNLKEDHQQYPLETTVETSVEAAVYIEEQLFEVEEVPHGLTIEELSADRIPAADAEQEEEEKERAVSLPEEITEAEENTAIPDSPSEETVSSPEDSSSSGEASPDEEEAVVTAEATPEEEEETKSEQTPLGSVGETTQLAAASTEPSLEVLSNIEPEPPSQVAPADKEEPCHSCHSSPSSSKEAAPPAALGEDLLDIDIAQEAKESFDKPLAKQTIENGVVVTATS
ncbi:fibrous sheath CABYR-binding protein [Poecilia reticulata]|uniref:fibrous sheath CABYR-binding protein n=1 Tax=Poecilia reticulata TaxID=8081 RepID=UPI0004A335C5|nr:PREDICTED: fibrous sheath CABYR-binding protein [Poecilia reticulata]